MTFRLSGGLCDVSSLPERVLPVDATGLADDARSLDVLARLALEARRCGYRIVVRGASPALLDLIELAGLSAALGVEPLRPESAPSKC
jgi:hypothetical protein